MVTSRQRWTFLDGMLLAGLVGLSVAATWSTWAEIIRFGFTDEEQSHILLTPLVALWLVYVRRERLRLVRPQWTLAGSIIIAAGWALMAYGFANSIDLGRHGGALLMACGAAITILGLDSVRRFLPAFIVLLFLLPIPGRIRQEIAVPLQQYTAGATQWLLELFAFPVSQHGNVLRINQQDVAVAEACNGMRMVAALALVSFAFVFSMPMRNSVRIAILALSPLVALLVNIIRLIPTVLMYGYTDNATADLFHDVSGWVMLFISLAILWSILALLKWLEVPIAPYSVAGEE